MKHFTRRQVLSISGCAFIVAATGVRPAFAATSVQDTIANFTGGKDPEEGSVTLDLPEIAADGNSVPMDIYVESPMTNDDYVKRVLVVADANPRPGVATFHFSPASGAARAFTKIRLSKTQNVIAVAEMSDGSFYISKRLVKVTIGGCGA